MCAKKIRYFLIILTLALVGIYAVSFIITPPEKAYTLNNIRVNKTLPSDNSAFTQGLEIIDDRLVMSTGMYGSSQIGVLDTKKGVLTEAKNLDTNVFGEGITATEKYIWQITWKEGIAYARDKKTLEIIKTAYYSGEGWGLCNDGKRIYMSDGSDTLTIRDPDSFEEIGKLKVTIPPTALNCKLDKITNINELEYANNMIYANIWLTDYIVCINPENSELTNVFNLTGLLNKNNTEEKDLKKADVLNGIAHISDNEFYITGKYWPHIFNITLDNTQ